MLVELFVFKSGKYPQGDFPRERVARMVNAYDPVHDLEAPAVIGHRDYQLKDTDEDELAHGWVTSLRMDGAGKVYASFRDISPKLRHYLADKQLQYISVEITPWDEQDPDRPPYLEGVAFLGRSRPQLATTRVPPMFARSPFVGVKDDERGTLIFSRALSRSEIEMFEGVPAIQNTETEQEGEDMPQTIESLQAQVDEQQAAISEFTAKQTALNEENAKLKAESLKAEAVSFFAELRNAGKLPPAVFDQVVSFDARLPGDEMRKEFRALFGKHDAIIDISGGHLVGAHPNKELPLSSRIKTFAAAKKIDRFEDAAAAYFAEHPEDFAETRTEG